MVQSTYHDQGQIALKLLGFVRGVTILGGLPIPMATPAHGTACDIQGKGIVDPSARIQAFRTLVMLARRQSAGTVAYAVYSMELGRPRIDGRLTLERGARADVSEPPLGVNCRCEHLQQYLA